jgi:hypothetical protein
VVYAIAVTPPPGEKIRMANFPPPAAAEFDKECDGKPSDAMSGQLGRKRFESERAAVLI